MLLNHMRFRFQRVFFAWKIYTSTRSAGRMFAACVLFHSFTIFSILLAESFEVYRGVFEEE